MRTFFKAINRRFGFPPYWIHQTLFEIRMVGIRLRTALPGHNRHLMKMLKQSPAHISFGCGEREHPSWIGVDAVRASGVHIRLDLRRPLPLS